MNDVDFAVVRKIDKQLKNENKIGWSSWVKVVIIPILGYLLLIGGVHRSMHTGHHWWIAVSFAGLVTDLSYVYWLIRKSGDNNPEWSTSVGQNISSKLTMVINILFDNGLLNIDDTTRITKEVEKEVNVRKERLNTRMTRCVSSLNAMLLIPFIGFLFDCFGKIFVKSSGILFVHAGDAMNIIFALATMFLFFEYILISSLEQVSSLYRFDTLILLRDVLFILKRDDVNVSEFGASVSRLMKSL